MGTKQKAVPAKKKPEVTKPENYDFVQCRSIGHNWQPRKADRSALFGYYLWLECTECEMIRMDTINALGRVGARSYRQPEGYKNPGISDRTEYRAELMKRLMDSRHWVSQDPKFELGEHHIERRLEARQKVRGKK